MDRPESRHALRSILRRGAEPSWPVRISGWLGLACASLAPLAFGSTQLLAVALLIAGLSLTLACGIWTTSRSSALCIGLTALLTALFPLLYAMQMSDGPASDPLTALMEMARQALAEKDGPDLRVSLHRDPFEALAPPLLCGLSISCGLVIGANVRSARDFQNRFAWVSAVYTAVALSLYFVAPSQVLWSAKRAHLTDFTATFMNRNTAAIFIGMGLACMSGVLARAIRQRRQVLSGRLPAAFGFKRTLVLAATAAAGFLVGLFLTDSRSGIALGVAAAVFPLVLGMTGRARNRNAIALAALLLLTMFPILVGLLDLRISSSLGEGGGRLDAYRATIDMIRDNPWFGVGLGNFVETFPLWRVPGSGWGIWDRAHNVWLELAAEAGLPLALLIGAAWLFVGATLARSALKSRRLVTGVPFAIYLLGTTHALVDFAIQIPGCGVAFYMLVGCGFAVAVTGRSAPQSPITRPQA